MRFTADSLTLQGVTRDFKRFSAGADENALSRLYAGIHFAYAVTAQPTPQRANGAGQFDCLATSPHVALSARPEIACRIAHNASGPADA